MATINKKWEGCGSSHTLSGVICEPAPPLQCPSADVFNTVDNNQKAGIHSGRIKEGSKVPISICTSMCHIVPKPDIFLQYNPSLGPQNWRKRDSLPAILEKVELFEQKAINEFQRYRGLFIEEILASVIQEHQNNTNYDYVDVAVANKGKVNTCSQCVCTYDKNASVCPLCNLDANSFPLIFDPYQRTETKHLQGKPSVYIDEPCMVNPNSIEAVKTIWSTSVQSASDQRIMIVANGHLPLVMAFLMYMQVLYKIRYSVQFVKNTLIPLIKVFT